MGSSGSEPERNDLGVPPDAHPGPGDPACPGQLGGHDRHRSPYQGWLNGDMAREAASPDLLDQFGEFCRSHFSAISGVFAVAMFALLGYTIYGGGPLFSEVTSSALGTLAVTALFVNSRSKSGPPNV
jgi:hypothetical protein